MPTTTPTNKDYNKLTAYCIAFFAVVLFIYILKSLDSIIIPFVIAAFLALMLDPVLEYITTKFKIPRWAGILILFLIVFTLVYMIGLLIYATLSNIPQESGDYMSQISKTGKELQAYVDGVLKSTADKLGMQVPKFDLLESGKGILDAGTIGTSLATFSTFLFTTVIVIVLWLFMISGKQEFEEKLYYAFAKKSTNLEETVKVSIKQIQSYMFVQTMINLGNAVVNTIIFFAFDIQFAALWGLLVFLLNYIPNIGPILAVIPPILLAVVNYGLDISTISLIVILITIQFFEGNVISPKLMGRQMDLSPVFVMLSIFFWGYVWGITGTFLAVPIACIIKIIVSNIEPLKPFALLLSARPKPAKLEKAKA